MSENAKASASKLKKTQLQEAVELALQHLWLCASKDLISKAEEDGISIPAILEFAKAVVNGLPGQVQAISLEENPQKLIRLQAPEEYAVLVDTKKSLGTVLQAKTAIQQISEQLPRMRDPLANFRLVKKSSLTKVYSHQLAEFYRQLGVIEDLATAIAMEACELRWQEFQANPLFTMTTQ